MSKHGFFKARAFTLIELLVVVAIIALLISILLPSLSRAKKQAKQTKCAAQLHDIGSALTSYSVEYGRFPHQNGVGPEGAARSARSAVALWGYSVHKAIAEYMGGLRESLDEEHGTAGQLSKTHEVFYCPFVPEDEVHYSYALSGPGTDYGIREIEEQYLHIGYTYFGRLDEVANDPAKLRGWEQAVEDVPIKRFQYAGVERSNGEGAEAFGKTTSEAAKVLMTDTIQLWAGGAGSEYGATWRINHGAGWDAPFDFGSMNTVPKIEGANEVFADGHAVWREPEHFKELIKAPSFAYYKRNATLDAGVDSFWW